MTPNDFENMTIGEITALADGYERRRERLEDIAILFCAMPIYQSFAGKRAPTFEQLTAYRKKNNAEMDANTADYWRELLDEVEQNDENTRIKKGISSIASGVASNG